MTSARTCARCGSLVKLKVKDLGHRPFVAQPSQLYRHRCELPPYGPSKVLPIGKPQPPRYVGSNKPPAGAAERFAAAALAILDETPNWTVETTRRIAEAARACGYVSEAATPVIDYALRVEQHEEIGEGSLATTPKNFWE